MGADVTFILDGSINAGAENFQKQLDFMRQIVFNMNTNSDDRVALVITGNTSTPLKFKLDEFASVQRYTALQGVLNGISQNFPYGAIVIILIVK